MFEKEAEEFEKQIQQEYLDLGKNGAYPPLWERIGELWRKGAEFGYNKAKAETTLLSQHILDLQKDKGNLTDKVRELEQQIEKMKNCFNCAKGDWNNRVKCIKSGCVNKDKWEIKEK